MSKTMLFSSKANLRPNVKTFKSDLITRRPCCPHGLGRACQSHLVLSVVTFNGPDYKLNSSIQNIFGWWAPLSQPRSSQVLLINCGWQGLPTQGDRRAIRNISYFQLDLWHYYHKTKLVYYNISHGLNYLRLRNIGSCHYSETRWKKIKVTICHQIFFQFDKYHGKINRA